MEDTPSAYARVTDDKVVEIVRGIKQPAGTLPIDTKRPATTLGEKLGAPIYAVFDDRVEQSFEVLDDVGAIDQFRSKLINEVRELGLKKARAVYPSVTDIGTLKFVHDFVLSVNPDARSLTPDLTAAQAVYGASLSAVSALEAADAKTLMNYDINTDPRWP